ncbi:hypothetical protein DSO57_1000417 [Entomophthora muscae]|uniref:Uncharacterized protein n=1 Tax=Entomophthora muscae TaxID=34485 RepID=A0ACC2UIW7_9FUNG|nr:hypothetical protein DSO57_1000417 [Entomophthora muscae]
MLLHKIRYIQTINSQHSSIWLRMRHHFIYFVFGFASVFSQSNKASVNIIEKFYRNNIGIDIYTKTWKPINQKIRARIVFVHGFAEHVNRYDHVFYPFAKAGLLVHGFDQIGCGKTGERAKDLGGAMSMERLRIDIDDAINRTYTPKLPIFLMGHSFGGATVLDYLARGSKRKLLYGSVATAPDLELAPETKPNRAAAQGLVALSFVAPNIFIPTNIDAKLVSRDKKEVAKYENDPYTFSRCAVEQGIFLIGVRLICSVRSGVWRKIRHG